MSEAGDNHIGGRDEEVGRETTGDAGKGRGDTGQRMPSDGQKKRGAHWQEQHVTDVAGRVGHGARENDDPREQTARSRMNN